MTTSSSLVAIVGAQLATMALVSGANSVVNRGLAIGSGAKFPAPAIVRVAHPLHEPRRLEAVGDPGDGAAGQTGQLDEVARRQRRPGLGQRV